MTERWKNTQTFETQALFNINVIVYLCVISEFFSMWVGKSHKKIIYKSISGVIFCVWFPVHLEINLGSMLSSEKLESINWRDKVNQHLASPGWFLLDRIQIHAWSHTKVYHTQNFAKSHTKRLKNYIVKNKLNKVCP